MKKAILLDPPSSPSMVVAKLNLLRCPGKMTFSSMRRSRWRSKTSTQPHGADKGADPGDRVPLASGGLSPGCPYGLAEDPQSLSRPMHQRACSQELYHLHQLMLNL